MRNRSSLSVDPRSAHDLAVAKSAQLSALLASVNDDGFDSFKRYAEEIQSGVLSLASSLADEVAALVAACDAVEVRHA